VITLGQIHLQHGTSVYDARSKIRSLAKSLDYNSIESTRLATAVSEAAREMRCNDLEPSITVSLAMESSPPQLVLDFESRNQVPGLARVHGFFDGTSEPSVTEGFQCFRALKWLPDSGFEASDDFIAEQSQRIQTLSREELMAEVEQKNRDLEQHSAQLEETVVQRTEQLEQAMSEADSANKAKGDFLANMSHEIRTPMNAIIGLSDLCLRTELNGKQRDYLSKVHGSAIALLGIINDILDFSKIEAGKLDIEVVPFSIDGVLEDLATLVQGKTQEKGLELLFNRSVEVPTILMGDPLRLGQILINLTNNAVKFTEKGEIVVHVGLEKVRGNKLTLRFAVTDTGIGMTDEHLKKLFQSFSQADTSTTRKYGGTGLGLVISKQLVEMMGGEIWVESEEGKGTTFGFTLVAEAGEGAKEKSFSPTKELKGLRCLVVEDNETSREILTQYLSNFHFAVESESSPMAVVERIQQGRFDFDLIVTDWKMPGMSGIELASEIRSNDSLEKQPRIILVSALHGVEIREKPGAENVDKYLAKPVSPSHLFDAIMECYGQDVASSKDRITQLSHDADDLTPIRGARVLLTEDNEINQQVASELLEQAGLVVDIANHGQEAIDMIGRRDYDVVLMDIQMPVMDGYTATQSLREDGRYTDLPILAMTANATAADSEKSIAAGMNAHINKPIIPAELFKALLTWVKSGREEEPDSFEAEPADVDRDKTELPDMAGFDTAAGILRVGGNADAYRRLLGKFVDNQALSVQELRNAIHAGDQELAVRTAHSLKGSAGALGIIEVQELAGEVEALLKKSLQQDDENLYRNLEGKLQDSLTLIRSVIGSPDSTSESLPEPQPVNAEVFERLARLQIQLDDSDSEAEDTLEELKADLMAYGVVELLTPIAKAVAAYDLESAAEQLPRMVKMLRERCGEQ
jgi:signal transduction histidine kinase/DNA-binding response OmpR family regulator/HPt (histidine-containing phosphotransfer) domain-containing protein